VEPMKAILRSAFLALALVLALAVSAHAGPTTAKMQMAQAESEQEINDRSLPKILDMLAGLVTVPRKIDEVTTLTSVIARGEVARFV